MAPDGNNRRKLRDSLAGVWPWYRAVAWTPDGNALVVMDREAHDDSTGLFRVGLDGTRRRLTQPPPSWTDAFPSVSADGDWLVFTRIGEGVTEIHVLRLDSGGPSRPVSLPFANVLHAAAVWLGETGDLLAVTERAGGGQLWRVPRSGAPVLLTSLPGVIVDIAASKEGDRGLLALRRSDSNLWTLPLESAGRAVPRQKQEIASMRNEHNAQYSPDGARIAFESNRSGAPEIWISGVDGRNAYQLTHFNGPVTGSPYWSPDGKWLVFDSRVDGQAAIFIAPAAGGAAKQITFDSGPNVVPSWSRDGKWIYFASGRSGRHEIWRVRSDRSQSAQLTKDGGFHAEEAPDGRTIYYTNTRNSITSLWRMNADGSGETEIAAPVLDRCFAVGARGVYFTSASTPAAAPVLRFLPFGAEEAVHIATLPKPIVHGLAVSPDGEELLFAQIDVRAIELLLVDGPFQ
jgi:Tol biopolymer transport system component